MKVLATAIVLTIVATAIWVILPKAQPKPPLAETGKAKQIQEVKETPPVKESENLNIKWQDNPNNCTADQWIAKEPPHYCIDKQSVNKSFEYTGSKEDWLKASGIPQNEWWAVDFVISRESSWRPTAVNPTSGACGLVQALPCSKIPGDWSDPVNALKWGERYVNSRYGSWVGAVEFWKIKGWY